ncbi:hypothetical protein XH81_04235 [Bradyrhizobium sp. CCBAU 25360]|nr:hypothetical protein [Bradyrhizobium sp. CCBAU 25360]
MIAFWSGQFLPGPEYFTTPFNARFQPGLYSTKSGVYGLAILSVLASIFYFYHSRRRNNVFGPYQNLDAYNSVRDKIAQLSERSGVRVDILLHDKNITNTDAIAFGFRGKRTILMGQGMLLLAIRRPQNFLARIAHELGHFRNGDIKYAFISRSLLQANLVLMTIIVVWLVAHPARVVLMQYYLFTDPTLGVPGADLKLFFSSHGLRWARYWADQVVGALTITVPVFAFWALLLFMEYRSLLRTREILADARAAQWVGRDALLEALTSGKTPPQPSLRDKLFELLSAHPLLPHRVDVVLRPHNVLQPSLLRFLFLGYLYSLTNYLISSINKLMQILNPRYGELLTQGNAMQALLSVLRFEQPIASVIYFGVIIALTTIFMIVVATLLRSSLTQRLSGCAHWTWLLTTIAQISLFAAGNVLGDAFHPYSQSKQLQLASKVMLGQSIDGLFFNRIGIKDILDQATPCGILLGVSILFWVEVNFIVAGSRSKSIKAWQWGALMVCTSLAVFQVWSIVWVARTYPDYINSIFLTTGGLQAVLYLVIALAVSWFMRGRYRSVGHTPGWLLAE